MADVMLRFEGKTFSDADERSAGRRTYREERLGRSHGESLLADLLPYPNRNIGSWSYSDRFRDRLAYEKAVLPNRITLLNGALSSHHRSAIICYGRGEWEQFKLLFDAAVWTTIGRFERASWRGAKVTLADHFVTPSFNSDTQLDELSSVALP